MNISTTVAGIRSLQPFSDDGLKSAADAMRQVSQAFGLPHLYAGIGIRPPTKELFERRSCLGIRLLLMREQDALVFIFAGSHDSVQAFLGNVR